MFQLQYFEGNNNKQKVHGKLLAEAEEGIVLNFIPPTRCVKVDFIFRIYSKQTDYVILTRAARANKIPTFSNYEEHFQQFNENKLEMKVDVKINLKFAIFFGMFLKFHNTLAEQTF